jgi:hypothetical protein
MNRRDNLGILTAALAASLILLWSTRSHAAPLTIKVCVSGQVPTFKAPAGTDRLEVRCPGSDKPVLNFVGCVGPKVTRVGEEYTITCAKIIPYSQVKQ